MATTTKGKPRKGAKARRRKPAKRASVWTKFKLDPWVIYLLVIIAAEAADFVSMKVLWYSFDQWGVVPHSVNHLSGIVFMPFLHSGWGHLVANVGGLLTLGLLIDKQHNQFWLVALLGGLISSAMVWAIPVQGGIHIGASGVVFVFIGFVLVRGLRTRRFQDIVIGALVGVTYATAIESLRSLTPGISWEGHAFGFVTGIVLAFFLSPKKKR